MDWYKSKNRNKSKAGLPGDTETGGTRFASIAFGYPNALWGEPQSPQTQTEMERKDKVMLRNGVMIVIALMSGGFIGVVVTCCMVTAKKSDEELGGMMKEEEKKEGTVMQCENETM